MCMRARGSGGGGDDERVVHDAGLHDRGRFRPGSPAFRSRRPALQASVAGAGRPAWATGCRGRCRAWPMGRCSTSASTRAAAPSGNSGGTGGGASGVSLGSDFGSPMLVAGGGGGGAAFGGGAGGGNAGMPIAGSGLTSFADPGGGGNNTTAQGGAGGVNGGNFTCNGENGGASSAAGPGIGGAGGAGSCGDGGGGGGGGYFAGGGGAGSGVGGGGGGGGTDFCAAAVPDCSVIGRRGECHGFCAGDDHLRPAGADQHRRVHARRLAELRQHVQEPGELRQLRCPRGRLTSELGWTSSRSSR